MTYQDFAKYHSHCVHFSKISHSGHDYCDPTSNKLKLSPWHFIIGLIKWHPVDLTPDKTDYQAVYKLKQDRQGLKPIIQDI